VIGVSRLHSRDVPRGRHAIEIRSQRGGLDLTMRPGNRSLQLTRDRYVTPGDRETDVLPNMDNDWTEGPSGAAHRPSRLPPWPAPSAKTAPISPVERQLPMMAVLEATHRSETQGQAVTVEYSL
jgi:hypothetical protein